jgi:outer membrane protein assembly factor BamB
MTFPGRLVAGGLLVLAGMVGVLAEDWPQFLGPRQDGTSLETGLVRAIPTNGLPVVWDRPIGTGYSAPSLLSGMLVVFHREKNEEIIEALDPATGASRWRHGYPSAYRDPYGYNNGPRCAPILTEQRVYTFGAEGKLTCVERATGKRVWQRDTAKDFNVPEAFFGVGSTPILEGGLLLVMVGGQTDAGVVAFDPETGVTRWESVGRKNWQGLPMHGWPGDLKVEWREWEKTASYASLRTATVNGERVLFACMRQGLVALNPTNGAVHFSRWFRARVDDSVNAMTPVVDGNQVLISSAYFRSGSVMLRMEPGNRVFAETWKGMGLEMHWSQPMLLNGHLYGFSGRNEPDAILRCVEWSTGKVKWERNERWPAHSAEQPPVFGRGSFILAEGLLIALGEGGLLGMFEPTPAECRELGRWQVPSMKYPCWAAPILSDRRLFLRSEDRLVCLNVAR